MGSMRKAEEVRRPEHISRVMVKSAGVTKNIRKAALLWEDLSFELTRLTKINKLIKVDPHNENYPKARDLEIIKIQEINDELKTYGYSEEA